MSSTELGRRLTTSRSEVSGFRLINVRPAIGVSPPPHRSDMSLFLDSAIDVDLRRMIDSMHLEGHFSDGESPTWDEWQEFSEDERSGSDETFSDSCSSRGTLNIHSIVQPYQSTDDYSFVEPIQVTCMTFDPSGIFVAVGYSSGQVVVLRYCSAQVSYVMHTEFQAHTSRFDPLTSETVVPNITSIDWFPYKERGKHSMLVANGSSPRLCRLGLISLPVTLTHHSI